jgi:hypothetical protein
MSDQSVHPIGELLDPVATAPGSDANILPK